MSCLPQTLREKSQLFEICILAGGASSRMGENKAGIRLGRKTMLGVVRSEVEKSGFAVRVIRRDLISRCGPLGGLFTGLKTAKAPSVLFLACDMPFISAEFLLKIVSRFSVRMDSLFVQSDSPGFPFILRRTVLPLVEGQIATREFSIHRLCEKLNARIYRPTRAEALQLFNVNTPEELFLVRQTLGEARVNR